MVTAWRIFKKKYRDIAFTGYGAIEYGGRWNSSGKSAIYTSSSVALALLENLIYNHNIKLIYISHEIGSISFSENEIEKNITIDDLPKSWVNYPAPKSVQQIGNSFFNSSNKAVLQVPSVIIPGSYPLECNYVINPLANSFNKIKKSIKFKPFVINERFIG